MYQAPRGFSILPPVVKNLLIINAIVYLYFAFSGSNAISDWMYYHLALWFPVNYGSSPAGFGPWQFVSYMFLHDPGSLFHILFNMFALWMFGSVLENVLGSSRFFNLYMISGIGAGLIHLGVTYIQFYSLNLGYSVAGPVLGASGAVYGILFTYAYYFPNQQIYLYFLFPVKIKYLMAGLIIMDLFGGFFSSNNVANFAHLGGVLSALLFLNFFRLRKRF